MLLWRLVVALLVVASAAVLTVFSLRWTLDADTDCVGAPGPTRVVAISLAGNHERLAEVYRNCSSSAFASVDGQRAQDLSALGRDYALIASYVALLVACCFIGSRISRRSVTRNCGWSLMGAALVAGILDVIENLLLDRIVTAAPDEHLGAWLTATTTITMTKFLLIGICAAYALTAVLGGLSLVARSILGRSLLPQFEPVTPRSPLAPTSMRATLHPPARPPGERAARVHRASAYDPRRYVRPDGANAPDALGLSFSGGGIRAAAFSIGAMQVLQQDGTWEDADYVSTVSGGGYAAMAFQTAETWSDQQQLDRAQPPMSAGSPEYAFVEDQARYLWPPLRKQDRRDGAQPSHTRSNYIDSTRQFLAVLGRAILGIGFNVALVIALLWVVAQPVGWLSRSWALATWHDTGPVGRPEWPWRILAAAAQGITVGLALVPALWPWWRKMARTPWGQAAAALLSMLAGAFTVFGILVVDEPVNVRATAAWCLLALLVVVAAAAWIRARVRWHGAWYGITVGLSVAGAGLTTLLDSAHRTGPSDTPDVFWWIGRGSSIAAVAALVPTTWQRWRDQRRLRRTDPGPDDGTRHAQPAGLEGSGALVALATVVGLALAIAFGRFGGSKFGADFSVILIAAGLVVALIWLVSTSASSGAPGFALAFVVAGVSKMWVDTAFERGPRAPGVWGLVTLIARLALVLAVLLTVVALWRVVVSATLHGRSAKIRKFAHFGGLGVGLGLATVVGIAAWSSNLAEAWDLKIDQEWQRWLIVVSLLVVVYAVMDQKVWSPHRLYKRRLAATFAPIRGTGDTRSALPWRISTDLGTWAAKPEHGPKLLLCAAAYDSDRFRPDETQAVPFVFESDYVGSADLGFARRCDFEALLGNQNGEDATLQAAAAISGAAVSSAQGAVRIASLSQLIALLNLRLGVWLPNPSYVEQLRSECVTGGRGRAGVRWLRLRRYTYLLKEFTSRYDIEDRFVYVTDGGQLENLGIYELFTRRCTTIYAFDASGDAPSSVNAMVRSMNLARARLGIRFSACEAQDQFIGADAASDAEFRDEVTEHLFAGMLVPSGGSTGDRAVADTCTTRFWATYPSLECGSPEPKRCLIVFGKARLTHHALTEKTIRDYADKDRKFPSNSTIDQFMDDEQFAAYVALGRFVATKSLTDVTPAPSGGTST